ncbi:hypothetical protein TSUD_302890, partial [Trifolium subterraneum]
MEETFVPFRGIKNDLQKRLMCYKQDWTGGLNAGFSNDNVVHFQFVDGILTAVQTLSSTALCGIIHSIIGGQPLLILGVAEPTGMHVDCPLVVPIGYLSIEKPKSKVLAIWIRTFKGLRSRLRCPVDGSLLRNKLVATARNCMRKEESLGQIYGSMQDAYWQMQTPRTHQEPSAPGLKELKESTIQLALSMGDINSAVDESIFDVEKEIDDLLPVEVKEQRVSNLLQSLMVGGCVAAMPFLKMIPTSLLWGYFAFMAIENLPGNQFWERILFIFTASSRRYKVLEGSHATYVETVPFKIIAVFTFFQTTYLLVCFGITWVPIAGVLFPLMIMLLVPVRQYILPKFFKGAHLQDLDAAEYEEVPALPLNQSAEGALSRTASFAEDGEILDGIITRSRGE